VNTIKFLFLSLFITTLLYFTPPVNSQPCYYLWWDSTYTGSGSAQDSAIGLALDNTGNFVYVTGWSMSGTYSNIVTIKYDAVTGNRIWTSTYDYTGLTDKPTAIAVDPNSGDVYVTGYSYRILPSNRDFVTIKYNPATGDTVWTRRYNGAAEGGDESYALGIDNSGNIFISGNSDQGATSADIVTIKYTPSGSQIVSFINLPNFQRPNALKINNNGDVFIAGITRTGANPTTDDYLTIKYNNSLTFQWLKTYNGTANNADNATALVTDASGNIYVTGFSYWSGQFFNYVTIKYNSNGDSLNAASYNGPLNNNDIPTSIGIDNANNIYVTGYSVAAISPDYVNDYATLQYNSSIEQQWVNRYNGTGNSDDKATSLAIDRFNNVYVTGFSANSLSFYDYLSIKYSSSGTPLCTLRQNVAGSNMNAYANQIVVDTAQVFYLTGSANVSGSGLNYLTIRNSLYPVGLKPLSGEVPVKFELYQNYPNPFNPITIIRFDVSAASIVKLAVFDVSGKEISILANEYLKPGVYEYSWDASGYSTGIYFYKLSTEKYSDTKKMALIK